MKKYVILAGVNGAGKSTLFSLLSSLNEIEKINLDDIVREFGNWRNVGDVVEAGKIVVKKINKFFDDGISFSQETTLCGKSILKNIQKARSLGYIIELHFVGLDSADLAKERVKFRVQHGGHGISEEDIDRRYVETLANLKKIISQCNLVAIYDNTISFRRFAIYKDGKCVRKSKKVPDWYIKNIE